MARGKHSGGRKEPRFWGIRRGKTFKEQLAREYGVEKVPDHIRQAMETTYRQLPDELPARHRPVMRAFRSMAAAAAVLALTFAALFGVNTTYPQLTEALPGLGPVFKAVNGGRQVAPQPTPEPGTPTPEPTQQPVFQPVTVPPAEEAAGDLGDLTVSGAFCDGKNICLELSLSLSDKIQEMLEKDLENYTLCSQYYDEGGGLWENTSVWEVSAGESSSASGMGSGEEGDSIMFVPGKDGGFTAQWRIPIYSNMDTALKGNSLRVRLQIPDLALQGYFETDGIPFFWSPSYSAEFEVPLDTSQRWMVATPVMDNGAALQYLEYAPSQVDVSMNLPYIGRYGDLLIDMGQDAESYLGLYATLESQDGNVRYHQTNGLDEQMDRAADPENGFSISYRFLSDNPQNASRSPLRLTVYETAPIGEDGHGRVVAEFTIDRNNGIAYASKDYLEKGYEQVDTGQAPEVRFSYEALMENGYLSCNRFVELDSFEDEYGGGFCTQFYLARKGEPEDDSGRLLTIRAYHQGEAVQDFSIVTGESIYDDTTMNYSEQPVYLSSGEVCTLMYFTLNYQDWNYNSETGELMLFDRLELLDGDTLETLIPDIEESFTRNAKAILGAWEDKSISEVNPDIPQSGTDMEATQSSPIQEEAGGQ